MTGSIRPIALNFGPFTLDLERGTLFTDIGVEKILRPKSFALLLFLVENAGRLVSQHTIMDAVWPNTYVTENSIAQCIHEIRASLGPQAHQTLRTCPRRGYRLETAVIAILSSANKPATTAVW